MTLFVLPKFCNSRPPGKHLHLPELPAGQLVNKPTKTPPCRNQGPRSKEKRKTLIVARKVGDRQLLGPDLLLFFSY